MTNLVPGFGPVPCSIMMVGEKPGREEQRRKRPFVGASGREQENYLNFWNLSTCYWYLTNIDKEYEEGNPDPVSEKLDYWGEVLQGEIARVQPKLIIAVGRFATQYFLGQAAEMNTVHGVLCEGGEFDESRKVRAQGAYVLPVYHPARGLHDSSVRGVIGWDYSQVAVCAKKLEKYGMNGLYDLCIFCDEYAGVEDYRDLSGKEIEDYLESADWERMYGQGDVVYVGLDTEGQKGMPESIQISIELGTGVVLRTVQPDFNVGIEAIRRLFGAPDGKVIIAVHNGPWDISRCLEMGLDLRRHPLFDDMYAAYVLRVEPQALSSLSWRLFRGHKVSFVKFVGKAARSKQIQYLLQVVRLETEGLIDKPETFDCYENNGEFKSYQPSSISTKAQRIIDDMDVDEARRGPDIMESYQRFKKDGAPYKNLSKRKVSDGPLLGCKIDKDGYPPDPQDRWKSIYKTKKTTVTGLPAEPMTSAAERILGPMPVASLADMPLAEATDYAARDADYALRAVGPLVERMRAMSVYELFKRRMEVVEPFREIEANGLLADRDAFVALSVSMSKEMSDIRKELSEQFFDGRPINPISGKDVGELLEMRGLEAKKTTKVFSREMKDGTMKDYGGGPSTATDSIAHLKFTDDAIDAVFRWRFVQHDLAAFVIPAIMQMDTEGPRFQYVTCKVATTRTPTTRLRMSKPNLQQVPTRRGPAIRNCYTCEPGELLVTADLAQIEWRVAAELSGDEDIINQIVSGVDTHTALASIVFKVPFEEVDKETQRKPSKTFRFLMNYGGGPAKLQDELWKIGLHWNLEQCEQMFIDGGNANPVLMAYIQSVIDDTHRTGMVRDKWGMINYLWPSKDPKIRAENGRQAWSYKDSGTAQGILQNSMVWLKEQVWKLVDAGVDVKWRLQLHDELMFTCPEEHADLLGVLIVQALTEHHGCVGWRVPIEANWEKAKKWGLLK